MKTKQHLSKQQKAYQTEAVNRADLHRVMKSEMDEVLNKFKSRYPDKFKELDASLNVTVFKRTPKGQGKTKPILAIVMALIDDRTASRKQIDILREVQEKFPDIPLLPNIWNKTLHPQVLKQIKEKINGNMAEPVSVHGCKKLTEIRKAIYASRKIKKAKVVVTRTISLSKTEIVIGKKVYSVQERPGGKKAIRVDVKGKRQWLPFAPLCVFLASKE